MAGPVLAGPGAIIAAIAVVIGIILLWKVLKFAFKLALIVAAAALLYFGLKWSGVL